MQNNKKLLLLTIGTLFIIISLSAISATTNDNYNLENTSSINTKTNTPVTIQNTTKIVDTKQVKSKIAIKTSSVSIKNTGENNFTQLNNIISNASEGDIIKLNNNFTRANNENKFTNGIIINKKITIEGNGYTINGTSINGTTGRIFNITSTGSLTLKNIIITGANHTDNGGAIIGNDNNIINVTFINNIAINGDGGVIWGYNNLINYSTFTNNSVINGDGGSLYGGYNNIINSNFTNDYAKSGGGAICGDNNEITNVTFINNIAEDCGGAINGESNNIINVIFKNNTANNGGAIFGDYNKIKNSSFSNNYVINGDGGALYGWYLNVINTTFVNNTANNGGALYGNDNKILNTSFISNIAKNRGGALYSKNNIITNSIFTGNIATTGTIYSISNLNVSNSVFVDNDNLTIYHDSSVAIISLNSNWWGTNNPDWSKLLYNINNPDNYVIMIFTKNTAFINNSISLTVSLNTLNDTTLITELPQRLVTFNSVDPNGSFTNNNTSFKGKLNSVYNGDRCIITAIIDNQELKLNLGLNTSVIISIDGKINNTKYSKNPVVKAIVIFDDKQPVMKGIVTFNITKEGNINKYYNTTLINTNIAILNITDILEYSPGTYNITVSYTDPNKINSNSKNDTIKEWTVTKTNSIITININITDKIIVTPTVTPITAKGNITYYIDGIEICTGQYNESVTLNNISSEKHNITAVYNGDNNTYSNKTSQIINDKEKTDIYMGNYKSQPGKTITLNATVTSLNASENINGIVIFKINGKTINSTTLVNKTAMLNYTIPKDYSNEKYTITAIYNGTDEFTTSTINSTLTLIKEETRIIVENITAAKGTTTKFIARVYDVEGNLIQEGAVEFKLNSKTLPNRIALLNGTATYYYDIPKEFSAKNYTITATYVGNKINAKSNGTLTITKGEVNITAFESKSYAGETTKLTTIVTDANGNMINSGETIFKINGKTLKDANDNTIKVKVINGIATLNYTIPTTFKSTDYKITTVFSDSNYNRQETNSVLTVKKASSQIYVNPIKVKYRNSFTVTATIKNAVTQLPISSGNVGFKIDGKTVATNLAIDSNGVFKYTVTRNRYKVGMYLLEIMYSGGQNTKETRINSTIMITY